MALRRTMNRSRTVLASLTALILSAAVFSTHAQQAPAFEVASIKPNTSGDERSSSIVQPGARYTATNVTLRMLIKTAYQVHDDQVVGGPGWIETERFDVAARGRGSPTTTEFRD